MAAEAEQAATGPPPEDEVGLDLTMKKKKKKKKVEIEGFEGEDNGAEGGDDGAADAPAEDGGLDLTMKKKKKKKVVKDADEDEFAAKLKAMELDGKEEPKEEEEEDGGDMEEGTGIWAHDENKPIQYDSCVDRFFVMLSQKNPDHALSGTKSHKIPPPQCMREGNKKTIFANIAEICKRMKRTEEHVTAVSPAHEPVFRHLWLTYARSSIYLRNWELQVPWTAPGAWSSRVDSSRSKCKKTWSNSDALF